MVLHILIHIHYSNHLGCPPHTLNFSNKNQHLFWYSKNPCIIWIPSMGSDTHTASSVHLQWRNTSCMPRITAQFIGCLMFTPLHALTRACTQHQVCTFLYTTSGSLYAKSTPRHPQWRNTSRVGGISAQFTGCLMFIPAPCFNMGLGPQPCLHIPVHRLCIILH